MKKPKSETIPAGDDVDWLRRSQMWQKRATALAHGRAKRESPRSPLILTGHGVSLRIEGGALTIRNGFTHYPQKQETYRFFKGELAIPERIILLDGSGSISFDVLAWLSEQRVSLVQINWKGEVSSFTSPTGYSGNPFRTKWQNETREHPMKRMAFCVSLIAKKIEASIVTLGKKYPQIRCMGKGYTASLCLADAGLTNIRRRMSPNCEHLRRMQRLHILEPGEEFQLNGEGPASDQFQILGRKLASVRRYFIAPEIEMRRIRSMQF